MLWYIDILRFDYIVILLFVLTSNSFGYFVIPTEYFLGSGTFPSMASNLILCTRVTKNMNSSALAKGSPIHTLLPWPRGTKCSGREKLPAESKNLKKDYNTISYASLFHLSGENFVGLSHRRGSLRNCLMLLIAKLPLGITWPLGRVT